MGVAPQIDAGEGLSDLPAAVGLDAVVQGGHRVRSSRCRTAWHRRLLSLLAMVWSICMSRVSVGGEGEGVGRGEQVHGLSMSLRDLIGIDAGPGSGGPADRGDLEPAPFTEMGAHPLGAGWRPRPG